jgi:hypothetical protein
VFLKRSRTCAEITLIATTAAPPARPVDNRRASFKDDPREIVSDRAERPGQGIVTVCTGVGMLRPQGVTATSAKLYVPEASVADAPKP